ncbi:MAG: lipopolysaccharide transport system permease protein [Myxococcota bacterium]|jgi:lipopolysaccharide transport system permease protein
MNPIVIENNHSLKGVMSDLWDYRELFLFLAWRDLLVRYKQTAIGLAWSVITPLLTMVVLTLVFGRIAKLPSAGVPYPILVFAALLPWQFFSSVLSQSSASLVNNRNMVSKVYFPRIIIPSTQVVVSLTDFVISLGILAGLMAWYGVAPSLRLLVLPPLILLAIFTSLGAGYWISALNVKYRDFRYIVPFMVQFGLYASPVGFSSDVVPEQWRLLYSLNPMVGVIDGFRWAIVGGSAPIYVEGLVFSVVLAITLFVSGVVFFLKTERKFADVI